MQPEIIPGPIATSGLTIPSVSIKGGSGFFQSLPDFATAISWAGILGFLSVLWSIYTILAYIFSIILLVLYVYASTRKNLYVGLQTQKLRDAERLYDERYRGTASSNRLKDVFTHIESENPNDWKLAIIEADIILDSVLKERGYPGTSLGERLKSLSSEQLSTLQDAWEAHKIRNRIAHDGADFVLTKRVAQETITRYQRVFNEFGIS
ncbi:hypothetical protein KC906_02460 [Candidatus Kaiserbacteria bacterium]|nr:hypothetical protein [Candidatus Kaiserbacteria bacterium]MCB9812160.1 hypothetical protein [Candidatus Nomurabacteria bacterium]